MPYYPGTERIISYINYQGHAITEKTTPTKLVRINHTTGKVDEFYRRDEK